MPADHHHHHRILVGLEVLDETGYARYRAAMKPILAEFGGAFDYDFVVAQTLLGPPSINRVFMIAFPDRAARERLFGDPRYLAVREAHFEPAVAATTLLAEFDDA